jgi:hypothetical protein
MPTPARTISSDIIGTNEGRAKMQGFTEKDADPVELALGIKTEMEHTKDPEIAKRFVLDHLSEFPHYYSEILLPAEKKAEEDNEDEEKKDDDEGKEKSGCKEHFTESVSCSLVEREIAFCGEVYRPDQAKAFVAATMLTSLPVFTKTRRAWTAATIANSAVSAKHQLVDREHNLLFYSEQRGSTKDEVIGANVNYDYPDKKTAMELAASGQGVPLKVLVCLFRKVSGVEEMLDDIPDRISLSQECEFDREESAFYDVDDKRFYPWKECSDEMKAILKRNTVDDWQGHKMLFCPGGEDGEVIFSGCAMTRWPLDVTAKTESLAAAEDLSAGAKAGEKQTILVATGHRNATRPSQKTEAHIVRLTKAVSSVDTHVAGARWRGDVAMKIQETCAGLRTKAASIKESSPEVSAMLEQIAAELDSAVSADVVETTIAEKIKAGELIPKEVVEQTLSAAIADARKYGRDELQKEISAAQEAAAKQAEATKTRLASVASAGLKPETPLGKDRTIQSVVSAMQAGEEGDKLFADRLEEWIAFKAAAAVPAKKESAASAGTGPAHCLGAQEPVAAPAEPQKVNRSLGLA